MRCHILFISLGSVQFAIQHLILVNIAYKEMDTFVYTNSQIMFINYRIINVTHKLLLISASNANREAVRRADALL